MPTRILIADDNPLFRTALRHVLEASDPWEITETRDGQEAVASIEIVTAIRQLVAKNPSQDSSVAAVLPDITVPAPETISVLPPVQLQERASPLGPATAPSDSGPGKVV